MYDSGKVAGEVPLPELQVKAGNGVPGVTPSDAAHMGKGNTVGGGPVATSGLQGLLFADSRFGYMPVRDLRGGGGLGGGLKLGTNSVSNFYISTCRIQ